MKFQRMLSSLSSISVFAASSAFAVGAFGGTLTVKFGSAMDVIEGGVTNSYAKNATFTPTAVPCVYMMRMGGLAAGERTFAIAGDDQIHSANYYRYPQYNDDGWIRVALNPYLSSDSTVTLTAYKVSKRYYVDEKNGNDGWDGTAATHEEGTSHGPKATLQSANDDATEGNTTRGFPVVYVAPGYYTNGSAVATYSSTSSNRRLVSSKNIAFIATAGAEETFIIGEPDTTTADGFGENAVGGVYMSVSSNPAYLQGFTITGCYSPATQNGIGHYGSAFCSSSHRVACLDCVISNNYAKEKYPATCYGAYQRTKFIENKSPSYLNFYGTFISCIFAGNRVTSGNGTSLDQGLHNQSHSYFCTYDLGDADFPNGRRRLNNASGVSINSALIYKMPNPALDQYEYWHACQTIDDPVFADATARDYRLGALSPAFAANSYETDLNGAMRRVMTSDVDGRMPVLHDGKMYLGAVWNDPPLPVTEIVGVAGGVSVVGASAGTNIVSSAGQITVTATQTATRPFLGFEVNGEMVAAPGGTYTFTPSLADGAVNSVKAIYSTDWYVDCVRGSDANPGTERSPKKTIRAATANAISGDVIHVAPGTYGAAEGAEKYKTEASSLCRVIIPAGVTIESTEGAERTFIVGAPAEGENANGQGNGPGAIRCVYAGNGATLAGFTLTGGHTAANKNADSYDTYGAALLTGNDTKANINDCVISNNYSHYATIFRTVIRRSRIIGNIGGTESGTTADAPAGSGCTYISCIIDGNRGNATVAFSGRIESSTFGTGNRMHNNGSAQMLYNNSGNNVALNSLFLYDSDRFQGSVYATNCIFRCATKTNLSASNCSNCLFSTSVPVTGYKPNYGSKAIDAGSNEIARYDIADETDIFGTPRALNGAIDIGAVEYDWRPTFSQKAGKGVSISYASPSVTTNAADGLLVPSGAVAGTLPAAGLYDFTFTLPSGSLEAFVGGVSAGVYSGAGERTIKLAVPDSATEFRLVYTPDPENPEAALLRRVASSRKFLVIVR